MTFPWLKLAACEWRQRPLRNAVAAAGVGIATAAVTTVLAFEHGYQRGLHEALDRLGAQVLIVPKGCPYDAASMALHGASWPCYLRTNYVAQVRAVPGVEAAVPVLMNAVTDGSGRPWVYLGSDPGILALKRGWNIAGRFPAEPDEILVGFSVAERRGWRVGDRVPLPGLPTVVARVCGRIDRVGDADDHFIYARLRDAQAWFGHEQEITHMLVRLADPNQLDSVVGRLRSCDAGMDMNIVPLSHLFRTFQELIRSTRSFLGCVAAVALLLAAAGVSNSMLMSLAERVRELGMMRTIGASRADLFRLVQLEAVGISLMGATAGMLAAWILSGSVEVWLRDRLPFVPSDHLVGWNAWIVGGGFLGSIVLGMLAAALPAGRACLLSPREATHRPRGVL
jgi:putative ABC transport system permease protein